MNGTLEDSGPINRRTRTRVVSQISSTPAFRKCRPLFQPDVVTSDASYIRALTSIDKGSSVGDLEQIECLLESRSFKLLKDMSGKRSTTKNSLTTTVGTTTKPSMARPLGAFKMLLRLRFGWDICNEDLPIRCSLLHSL